MGPRPGAAYHAFVEDNRPDHPHRVTTDLRFIDIVPYRQDYQFKDGNCSSGSSVTLEELIARQRVNLNQTFAHESDRPVAPALGRRLAVTGTELAAVTAEFADGLEQRGADVRPLREAHAAMKSAAAALSIPNLARGRSQEEAALSHLVKARHNLRKCLNPNSQSQSACRAFDRQQEQKLRRPPPDRTKEQVAKLPQDLRKLAQAEREFAQGLQPAGRGGPRMDPPEESPPGSKSASSNPAAQQRQAAQEADRLKQLASRDESLSELARRRLDAAAQDVHRADEGLQQNQPAAACDQASSAASQLDRLARQVGALQGRDLGQRLAGRRCDPPRSAPRRPAPSTTWPAPSTGSPPYGTLGPLPVEGVDAVVHAFQAQIQALILESALVDRDGPAPPQYRTLVEDYFRVLSEDLR